MASSLQQRPAMLGARLAISCGLLVTALARPASAEPLHGFFRFAPGATVASFHQTQVYESTVEPGMVETAGATQLGGQLEATGGVQLGRRVQVGGLLRYAMVPNVDDATNYPKGRLGYTVLGPQLTVFATRRLYVRSELGLANLSHHGYGDRGLALGAEIGSGAIVQGRFLQFGLAASRATMSARDFGDRGTYTTDSRITTVSAVLSMNLGSHP